MFTVSPELFFFMGITPVICVSIAHYIIKSSANLNISVASELKKYVFLFYLILVASLSFFPVKYDTSLAAPVFRPSPVNLIPLHTIIQVCGVLFVNGLSFKYKLSIFGFNIASNFFILLPLGFFLPLLNNRFKKYILTAAAAAAVSFILETVQFAEASYDLANGLVISIDDILLNLTGALLGFALWHSFSKKKEN